MSASKEDFHQRMASFAEGRENRVSVADLDQMMHVATEEEQDQTLLQRMVTR